MNQELLTRIAASSQLPTLPAIAIRVLELTQKDDVNISEIADLIVNDPALASKVLRTVNSPFYGLPKQVSTISHALVVLGLQAVKTLALGFSLVNNLTGGQHPTSIHCMDFWKRAIYSAVACRQIARRLALVQQEEAFLAGLLANIGVMVMHRVLGEPFDSLFAQAAGDDEHLIALCREKFDLDPPAVAGMLAEKWQLPPVLAHPIALYHDRTRTDPQTDALVDVVGAGVIVGQVFASQDTAHAITRARSQLAARFQFPPHVIEELLEDIGRSTRDVANLFQLHIGPQRTYQQILDEARAALEALSLQGQQQVQTIQRQVENLQVKAATDALTGLPNRAHFDEFFAQQFHRAYSLLRPLAVLFIDLDRFKSVNDTHGHDAGDAVLRRIGKILKASVRNIDLAARHGGEEFAIIFTETETAAAALRAETLRKAIAAQHIDIGGKTIQITASIGVAGTDRSRIFSQPAQLLACADRAVYAAKSAGRNAVRVFRPKVDVSTTPAAQIPAAANATQP